MYYLVILRCITMADFERRVGPKGQVVIPKEIRRITGIRPEAEVFVSEEGGRVLIKRRAEKISEKLNKLVEKDGKFLTKIDTDKYYEEQIKEKFKK